MDFSNYLDFKYDDNQFTCLKINFNKKLISSKELQNVVINTNIFYNNIKIIAEITLGS